MKRKRRQNPLTREYKASTHEDYVYYSIIDTPAGRIPLVGATMTDERERELASKYPVIRNRDYEDVMKKECPPILLMPVPEKRKREDTIINGSSNERIESKRLSRAESY